ncbi:MAG: hypothetical protein C0478_12410 [Planctomyces sp.]|nr:hypothetical protein [Planctomyces sp.]
MSPQAASAQAATISLIAWCLLAGLPLALILGSTASSTDARKRNGSGLLLLSIAGLMLALLLAIAGQPLRWLMLVSAPTFGFLGALLLRWWNPTLTSEKPALPHSPMKRLAPAFALALALIIPWQLSQQRLQTWSEMLSLRMREGRFVAAGRLMEKMDLLAGDASKTFLSGISAKQLAASIQDCLDRLQTLPRDEAGALLERAKLHLQLEQFDLAREALAGIPQESGLAPMAASVEGLLHQFAENWLESETAFVRSILMLRHQETQSAAASFPRTATTNLERENWLGAGFAARKQGEVFRAEEHYLQALRLADKETCAQTHFLIAQFYEDSQQSIKSAEHARLAADLNPAEFLLPADQLLRQLKTGHLGCMWIPSRSRSSSQPPISR